MHRRLNMPNDPYLQFVCKHRTEENELHTHLDLFGGKYTIRANDNEKFLSLRANAIERGVKDAISEIASPVHPLHFDIDGKAVHEYNFPYLEIAKCIQVAVSNKDNVPTHKTHMIVLTAPPDKEKEEGYSKHGMHIVFPYVKSSFEMECLVCNEVLTSVQTVLDAALNKDQPRVFAENIIDTCIYKGERGIGLRMPFAYKVDKLDNGKRHYVNRRYTVYGVVRHNGELDPTLTTNMRSNIHLTLKLCSIRSHHAPMSYIKKRKHSDITIDAKTIRKDQEILDYAAQIHESFRNTTIIETKNVDPKYGHNIEFVLDNHRYCPYMQKVHNQSCLYLTLDTKYGLLGAGCWCRKHDCIRKYKPNKIPLPQHLCKKYGVLHNNGLPKGFM